MSTTRLAVLTTILLTPVTLLAQPAPEPTTAPAAADPPVPAPPVPAPPAPAAPATPLVVPAPRPLPVAGLVPSAKPEGGDKPDKPVLVAKPGGYLQADSRMFPDDSGTHDISVRRLRFKLDGTAYKYINFRTLIDFASSKLVVDDAYAELALRPELVVRFGKDKAQFGIERLQSAASLTFIERSYPTQIAPNRDLGIAVRGDVRNGLVHYSAALVDGVADNAVIEGETDTHLEANLHLLLSPLKAVKGYGDLAIGAAATFGRSEGTLANPGLTAIKSAGQATIVKFAGGGAADDLAHTARTDGFRRRFAAHGYYFGGPVGVLAEYVRDSEAVVLLGNHAGLTHQAWQLASSIAVTPGDRPSYKGLKPKQVFDPSKGTWGALEVGVRYAELKIDPDTFDRGIASEMTSVRRARAFTLGLNWYLNEFIKLQLDYELTKFTAGAMTGDRPSENLISTRFQVSI